MKMTIRPVLAFRNPCIPVNEMDVNKNYRAIIATNQPNWFERKAIFAGGHLLVEGEYIIIRGKFPLTGK